MKSKQPPAPLIISISSGKGGVGKTSFSVNFAAALAKLNKRVLLIDGDLGLANVDVLLGLNVRRNLQATVEEGCDPTELLLEVEPGFMVLPASSGIPEMANLSSEEQAYLTDALEPVITRFDLVLVDTAAGLGEAVLWFNDWAMENIVILSPDPTSMTDAYALIKVLHTRYDKKRFHLLVNSSRSDKEATEVFSTMRTVLERFLKISPHHLGVIPQDEVVSKAVRRQKPFLLTNPNSRAGKAVHEIAERIIGSYFSDICKVN
jgi:flagellar biosynthesis protein FlhG